MVQLSLPLLTTKFSKLVSVTPASFWMREMVAIVPSIARSSTWGASLECRSGSWFKNMAKETALSLWNLHAAA